MAKAKALVLHDDPRTVAMVQAIGAAEGFDVVSAASPFRLLEGAIDAAPDLVLLGLAAVDDRDLDLVGVLRRRWPDTVILVIFPALLRERAARCLDLGADGYLPEPFYPGELSALARAAAARAGAAAAPSRGRGEPGAGALAAAPDGAFPADDAPAAGAGDPANEALSKLAAGIAHTIRNPLQIVELQLGTFETDGKLDLAGIREQLARVAGVAESLTRFSGRRKLNTRLVDVNALLERVFGDGATRRRAVRIALAPERLEVLGAPELLRAAMDAIHERAQRVTPEGAEIAVSTAAVEVNGVLFAEIVVTDGGPRTTAAEAASVFDPFPDADRVMEGSGMEMAAAAGIVRNHGGSVGARAGGTSGTSGTSVVVRLPARGRGALRAPGEVV